MKNPWLHRSAILLAILTLIVIGLGASVTSEIRPLPGVTAPSAEVVSAPGLEQAHRIGGYAVALLTLGLAIWYSSLIGWIALAAIVIEGVLGSVPIIHAWLSPIIFSLVV